MLTIVFIFQFLLWLTKVTKAKHIFEMNNKGFLSAKYMFARIMFTMRHLTLLPDMPAGKYPEQTSP